MPPLHRNARGYVGVVVLLCAAAIPVAWLQYSASDEVLTQTRSELADLPKVEALQARMQSQLDGLCHGVPSAPMASMAQQAVDGLELSIKQAGSASLILDPQTPAYYLAYLCTVKWPERGRLAAHLLSRREPLTAQAQEHWAEDLSEESRALTQALADVPPDLAQPLRLQQQERQDLAAARPFDRHVLCQAAQADRRLWLMSLQLMENQLKQRAQGQVAGRDIRLAATVALLLVLLGSSGGMLRQLLLGGAAVEAKDQELAAAVRAHETRFQLLFELSSEAVLLADADRKVIYASPSLEPLLGYSPDERVGTKIFTLTHPEDQEGALDRSTQVRAADGVKFVFRCRMRHKDGRWRVIELSSVSHLRDPALACVVSTLRDVTDTADLQREVEANAAHYRALVENADDLLLFYRPRPELSLRAENPQALRMLGLPADYQFSARSLELLHPEDLPAVIKAVDRALREPGKPINLQARMRDAAGRWRDYEGRGRGLSGEHGVLITLRDVTDGRAVQKQLVRYERLAAIGQTASGLAHEVRNPLAVVSTTAEYMKEQLADRPTLQKDLDAVMDAVDRIRDLVSDVLERSRDRELKPVAVPADQLMDQACRAAQLRFGPAGERVKVLRSYGSTPPMLRVDVRQMDRVITNLALNALQAMHGDGSLTLSAAVEGQSVVLEVADDGPGIPETELAKVFEPFFTTKEQGSGLGLWICKSIVEEHGGQLEAHNRKPRGCAFSIRLPLEGQA